MDNDLKEYWKLFIPVAMKILKTNFYLRNDKTRELFGITTIHVMYILALNNGKHTLKELSNSLFFDKANTTRAISSLKKMGYVDDDRIKKNSKKYNIFLTEKGLEVARYINDDINTTIDQAFDGISDDNIRRYISTLEKVCRNVDKDSAKVLEQLKLEMNSKNTTCECKTDCVESTDKKTSSRYAY